MQSQFKLGFHENSAAPAGAEFLSLGDETGDVIPGYFPAVFQTANRVLPPCRLSVLHKTQIYFVIAGRGRGL